MGGALRSNAETYGKLKSLIVIRSNSLEEEKKTVKELGLTEDVK